MTTLDEFRFRWLDEVHANSRLGSAELHVAFSLSKRFLTGVDLSFDASMSDLAIEAGVSRRGLQRVFSKLKAVGLLEVRTRYGRNCVNTFAFKVCEKRREVIAVSPQIR